MIALAVTSVVANQLCAESEALRKLCNGGGHAPDMARCIGCSIDLSEGLGDASTFKIHCVKGRDDTQIHG